MEQARTEHLVRLLSTCQEKIYRYVFTLLPNEQDARDVVQETCVALCRKFDDYDDSKPFLPWAYRFAYLEVLKHRQQKQRRSGILLSDDVVELLAKQRDEQSEMLEARLRALEDCLRKLPPADCELIRGRYHARTPIGQLAQQAAMSQRTLFRNLERVRRVLFDCITGRLSAEGL
ncbi:MAG: sigma-70 family RNA polymerase sigma factor [Pirellulaceae bacterium]